MAMSSLTYILGFSVRFFQPVFLLFGWYSDGPVLSSFLWQFKIQDGHNNPTYLECILKYLFLIIHLAKWSEIWHKSSNDGTL